MDKRRPRFAHQLRELDIALRLLAKRVNCVMLCIVSQAIDVIEDECDLLEVSDSCLPRNTGRDGVESIAVRGNIISSPGLARATAICNHNDISEIRSAASILIAVRRRIGDLADFGDRRNPVAWDIWIRFQEAWCELLADISPFICAGGEIDKIFRIVYSLWSESGAFISIGTIDDLTYEAKVVSKLCA